MSSRTDRKGPRMCAMRGNCGKASMFGQDLPCVDDGNATEVSPNPLYKGLELT